MGVEVPSHEKQPPVDGETILEIGPGKDPMRWPKRRPKKWCDLYVDVLNKGDLPWVDEHGLSYEQGTVENLSFIKDNSFDFVYARQILEHTSDPALACRELSRVAKRGYVATPSIFGEIFFGKPLGYHNWLIIERGGTLCFFQKRPFEDRPFKGWYINAVHKPSNDVHLEMRQHFIDDLSNEDCVHLMEYNWTDTIRYAVFWENGKVEISV